MDKIGGAGEYDAIGGTIYNTVMNASLSEIFSPDFVYAVRIQGAMSALAPGAEDLSNGAYVWNATSQKDHKDKDGNPDVGFNWRTYNRGIYIITTTIGGTTFFRYKEKSKTWP